MRLVFYWCSIFGRFLVESVRLSSICGRVSSICAFVFDFWSIFAPISAIEFGLWSSEFDLCICVRVLVDFSRFSPIVRLIHC